MLKPCAICEMPLRKQTAPHAPGTRVHAGRGLCARCHKHRRDELDWEPRSIEDPNREWRQIPGLEGRYEASSAGEIRSVDRTDALGRQWKGRVRKLRLTLGYPVVSIIGTDGKFRVRKVHQLVAAAFIGPRPEGMETCHIDGDRLNNNPANLRYATSSENEYDKVRHGRHHEASKTHCANGHEFTSENTIRSSRGRECRACRTERGRRADARRRAARRAKQGVAA